MATSSSWPSAARSAMVTMERSRLVKPGRDQTEPQAPSVMKVWKSSSNSVICARRPVHMGIAQHLAAHRHARLVAFALLVLRQVRPPGDAALMSVRQHGRLLDAGNVPCPVDQREARAGNEIRRALDHVGRRRAVLVAGDAEGRRRDPAGIRPQICIADRRAGSGIAVSRRAHQHVAPACDLVRLRFAEQRREPALQDIVGDAARCRRSRRRRCARPRAPASRSSPRCSRGRCA